MRAVAIYQAIVHLKAEYPPFRPNELATICEVRFERRPSRATIQKLLSTEPSPGKVQRRMADYYFARATTWEELLQRHAAWVMTSTARSTGRM